MTKRERRISDRLKSDLFPEFSENFEGIQNKCQVSSAQVEFKRPNRFNHRYSRALAICATGGFILILLFQLTPYLHSTDLLEKTSGISVTSAVNQTTLTSVTKNSSNELKFEETGIKQAENEMGIRIWITKNLLFIFQKLLIGRDSGGVAKAVKYIYNNGFVELSLQEFEYDSAGYQSTDIGSHNISAFYKDSKKIIEIYCKHKEFYYHACFTKNQESFDINEMAKNNLATLIQY